MAGPRVPPKAPSSDVSGCRRHDRENAASSMKPHIDPRSNKQQSHHNTNSSKETTDPARAEGERDMRHRPQQQLRNTRTTHVSQKKSTPNTPTTADTTTKEHMETTKGRNRPNQTTRHADNLTHPVKTSSPPRTKENGSRSAAGASKRMGATRMGENHTPLDDRTNCLLRMTTPW